MDWKSFVSKTVEVGSYALESVSETVQNKLARIERYKERYRDLDDRALATKYRTTTGDERIACRELIQERMQERGDL